MKLTRDASLRKLARAIARKQVPPERANIIEHALVNAHRRYKKYQHSHERHRTSSHPDSDVLLTPPPLGRSND